jgi:pre-rRNA-processing protein SRD1
MTTLTLFSPKVRVATRPNPRIDLGPIDCSAAVIICDTFQEDNPIVYCSEAFTVLTGYSESETLGRNCRFLQHPPNNDDDRRESSSPRRPRKTSPKFPGMEGDQRTELHRMKHSLQRREEVQVMVGNYTRSGTPFANLVSVVPVKWNLEDPEERYLVGFQTRWDESKSSTPVEGQAEK